MFLNFSGKQDVYIEVADHYKNHILLGVLSVGEKLPSVRVAAGELGVNPNTVAKAYAKLEQDGYICSLPKKGVYVIWEGGEQNQRENADLTLIRAIRDRGIDKQTILSWIEEVYKSHD